MLSNLTNVASSAAVFASVLGGYRESDLATSAHQITHRFSYRSVNVTPSSLRPGK